MGLGSFPLGAFGFLLSALGLTGARLKEQAIPGRTEFLDLGLCLLLCGGGTSYLNPLPGHGSQVLYFPYIRIFIPGLLSAQESLFSLP
jgi:hypothetical protein